jgi:hypothetical protein
VFTASSKNGTLTDDIWICDSAAYGHYCKSTEGMFNMIDIYEKITAGNGNSMTATNFGSLKCCVVVCALISNSKCENSDENYHVSAIV